MKRFCIPAMILVSRETAEQATEFASDAACSVNHETRADGPKLYLCEASPTSAIIAADHPGGYTLHGLTCDYAEVLRLRELLSELVEKATAAHAVLDNYITADDSEDDEIKACDDLWEVLPRMREALK